MIATIFSVRHSGLAIYFESPPGGEGRSDQCSVSVLDRNLRLKFRSHAQISVLRIPVAISCFEDEQVSIYSRRCYKSNQIDF